jgi:hypothetical protein
MLTKRIVAATTLFVGFSPGAFAVQIQCADDSTTFVYGPGDLSPQAGGIVRDSGVGNRLMDEFNDGCALRLRQPAKTSGAGTIRIQVAFSASWEGVVDPESPTKGPNRTLFQVESMIGPDYQIEPYRLGDMAQTVRWTDAQGRYDVDAVERPEPFVSPAYGTPAAADKIDVLICEIQGGVDVVVKEVRIETDLADPQLCPQ